MNNLAKNAVLAPFNLLYHISPSACLKAIFRLQEGYPLDLEHPKTYNEKLQWIKLNDHNPLMPQCCDKYAVRRYVEEHGCSQYLNELYWQGFDPTDIPFDDLPDSFVIKVTHGSGFNIIVHDKAELDRQKAIDDCRRWLKAKFLPCYGEWFYGVERPRVVVERYLENPGVSQLFDYKVFCFNGRARLVRLDTDRFTDHKMFVYDRDWNRLYGHDMGYHTDDAVEFERPACLDDLLVAAESLSEPFYHARVDFYILGERIVFGEITFTNGAGFDTFHPESFDREMGEMLRLPCDEEATL